MSTTQPFIARNPFYAAQLLVADTIASLKQELASRDDGIKTVLGEIRDVIAKRSDGEQDVVTAIYMVGIGPSGGVTHHSPVGDWIRQAWTEAKLDGAESLTICEITKAKAASSSSAKTKFDTFRAILADSARFPADPRTSAIFSRLDTRDVDRFLSLAPSMCDLAKAHPVVTTSSPTDPSGAITR